MKSLVLVAISLLLVSVSVDALNTHTLRRMTDRQAEELAHQAVLQAMGSPPGYTIDDLKNSHCDGTPLTITEKNKSPADLWLTVKDALADKKPRCFKVTIRSKWNQGDDADFSDKLVGFAFNKDNADYTHARVGELDGGNFPANLQNFKVFFHLKMHGTAAEVAWIGKSNTNNPANVPSLLKITEFMVEFFKKMDQGGIETGGLDDFAGTWCKYKANVDDAKGVDYVPTGYNYPGPLKFTVLNLYKYGHAFYTSRFSVFPQFLEAGDGSVKDDEKNAYCTKSQAIADIGKKKLVDLAGDFANDGDAKTIWAKMITNGYQAGTTNQDKTLAQYLKDTGATGFANPLNAAKQDCVDRDDFYYHILKKWDQTSDSVAAKARKAVADYFFDDGGDRRAAWGGAGKATEMVRYTRYLKTGDSAKNAARFCRIDNEVYADQFLTVAAKIESAQKLRNSWFDWGQV